MKKYYTALFILVVFLGGCDTLFSSDEEKIGFLTIETDQQIYTVTQRVEVSFINNTNDIFFYSPCGTVLQRFNKEAWSNASAIMCTAIPREPVSIKPGETFNDQLWWFSNHSEEGDYRVVFLISDDAGNTLPLEKRSTGTITFKN